ncbi:MAG: ATP-dependent Clp protease ATP-binding subunit ClpA, partial [Rhabdaerophilum sp.]
VSFGNLPREVIAQVVDKFIAGLEAQLADRHVTISLSDEAREWLVEHGYDGSMGARPMARLIQATIKTPLAEEVLFGRLKGGGAVRVVVIENEGEKKLGLDFPEGPIKPRPEAIPAQPKPKARAKAKARKAAAPKATRASLPKPPPAPPLAPPSRDPGPPDAPKDEPPKPRRSPVPKLPLKK